MYQKDLYLLESGEYRGQVSKGTLHVLIANLM
jgi:hypothetical protein